MRTPEQIAEAVLTKMDLAKGTVGHGNSVDDLDRALRSGWIDAGSVMLMIENAAREAQREALTPRAGHEPGCHPDPNHPGYWYCTKKGHPQEPIEPQFKPEGEPDEYRAVIEKIRQHHTRLGRPHLNGCTCGRIVCATANLLAAVPGNPESTEAGR